MYNNGNSLNYVHENMQAELKKFVGSIWGICATNTEQTNQNTSLHWLNTVIFCVTLGQQNPTWLTVPIII